MTYRASSIVKPNRRELAEANKVELSENFDLGQLEDLMRATKLLQCDTLFVTLSEMGMAALDVNNVFYHRPALSNNITDVCGAGDSVFAVAIDSWIRHLSMEKVLHRCLQAGKAGLYRPGTLRYFPRISTNEFRFFRIAFTGSRDAPM